MRCSTEEQNPQRQKHILRDAGCERSLWICFLARTETGRSLKRCSNLSEKGMSSMSKALFDVFDKRENEFDLIR